MTPEELVALQMQIRETAAAVSIMKPHLDKVESAVTAVQTDVTVLRERSDRRGENCPMRVDIARAANGVTEARKDAEEAKEIGLSAKQVAHENEISLAKLGAAAGGGGAFGALVFAAISYFLGSGP